MPRALAHPEPHAPHARARCRTDTTSGGTYIDGSRPHYRFGSNGTDHATQIMRAGNRLLIVGYTNDFLKPSIGCACGYECGGSSDAFVVALFNNDGDLLLDHVTQWGTPMADKAHSVIGGLEKLEQNYMYVASSVTATHRRAGRLAECAYGYECGGIDVLITKHFTNNGQSSGATPPAQRSARLHARLARAHMHPHRTAHAQTPARNTHTCADPHTH